MSYLHKFKKSSLAIYECNTWYKYTYWQLCGSVKSKEQIIQGNVIKVGTSLEIR